MRDALRETRALTFSNTNIERIFAYVFSSNFASQKQLLDSGFKQEAILQRGTCKMGFFTIAISLLPFDKLCSDPTSQYLSLKFINVEFCVIDMAKGGYEQLNYIDAPMPKCFFRRYRWANSNYRHAQFLPERSYLKCIAYGDANRICLAPIIRLVDQNVLY